VFPMGELPFKRTPRHFAGKRFVILGRFAAIILPTYLSELGFSHRRYCVRNRARTRTPAGSYDLP
jgi:hypothetical protein